MASYFRELPSTSRLSGVPLHHNTVEDADASLKDAFQEYLQSYPKMAFQIYFIKKNILDLHLKLPDNTLTFPTNSAKLYVDCP